MNIYPHVSAFALFFNMNESKQQTSATLNLSHRV